LYSGDGSHPSLAGSYAVACAFYTMVYKKDPTLITFNSTLTENEANIIKMATKTIVFDEITNWDYTQNPVADYSEVINGAEVAFTNTSSSFDTIFWNFGDANTSTEFNPIHTYAESSLYNVSQTITKCGKTDTKTKTLNITVLSTEIVNPKTFSVYPNPTSGNLTLLFNKKYKKINSVISDLSGKVLLSTSVDNVAELLLNITTLSKGIYILNIKADGQVYVEEIVKK
jgi:PKD repeat protein